MLHAVLDPSLLDPSEAIRKLSRLEFDKLVDLGSFEDERTELLRGLLVAMGRQGESHAATTAWFARSLGRVLGGRLEVRVHALFAATDDSEPRPDVSVRAIGSRDGSRRAMRAGDGAERGERGCAWLARGDRSGEAG
jgi:Uma2 family endonuclease